MWYFLQGSKYALTVHAYSLSNSIINALAKEEGVRGVGKEKIKNNNAYSNQGMRKHEN